MITNIEAFNTFVFIFPSMMDRHLEAGVDRYMNTSCSKPAQMPRRKKVVSVFPMGLRKSFATGPGEPRVPEIANAEKDGSFRWRYPQKEYPIPRQHVSGRQFRRRPAVGSLLRWGANSVCGIFGSVCLKGDPGCRNTATQSLTYCVGRGAVRKE
jgi:hypothetical protein